jgi:hypothetical protein
VLSTLASDVLRPQIVDAVIAGVLEALRRPAEAPANRESSAAELTALEREIKRLTEAIAIGRGDLRPLVEALEVRQTRRAELLEARRPQTKHACSTVHRKAIERAVHERLEDWRALFTRNVQDAREPLRQVLCRGL